jgi:hypothetical protein
VITILLGILAGVAVVAGAVIWWILQLTKHWEQGG